MPTRRRSEPPEGAGPAGRRPLYIDADILGLAKVLAALRSDVTYPGDLGTTIHRRARPACPISNPGTDDDAWIPEVTAYGWLIVTRDKNIQSRPAEIAAVRNAGARIMAQ